MANIFEWTARIEDVPLAPLFLQILLIQKWTNENGYKNFPLYSSGWIAFNDHDAFDSIMDDYPVGNDLFDFDSATDENDEIMNLENFTLDVWNDLKNKFSNINWNTHINEWLDPNQNFLEDFSSELAMRKMFYHPDETFIQNWHQCYNDGTWSVKSDILTDVQNFISSNLGNGEYISLRLKLRRDKYDPLVKQGMAKCDPVTYEPTDLDAYDNNMTSAISTIDNYLDLNTNITHMFVSAGTESLANSFKTKWEEISSHKSIQIVNELAVIDNTFFDKTVLFSGFDTLENYINWNKNAVKDMLLFGSAKHLFKVPSTSTTVGQILCNNTNQTIIGDDQSTRLSISY